VDEVKQEEKEYAIKGLADWIEKEKLPSIRSFPERWTIDTEHAISYAQAIFLVPRNIAEDLTDSAFCVAHERYLKNRY